MTDPLFWHRLQFGFTITYHYLFPQLTMGLALLVFLLRLRGEDASARFWVRILALNFGAGVVTGIPMEFQFGTNWQRFSEFSGGVIAHTLAMEGLFAFFAESSVLGFVVFAEKRMSRSLYTAATGFLFAGTWLSGYFIVATNAFMQHPEGYSIANGRLQLDSFGAFVFSAWAFWEFAHTMCAAVITGAFVMAGVAAFWTLQGGGAKAAPSLRMGVIAGVVAAALQLFPTGDRHGKLVAEHQPVALAAMEGVFRSEKFAELAIIGQPDVNAQRLENPIFVPGVLSFLAYGSFGSTVHGLSDFPRDQWPDNIELLYYAYHVMVGLGTLFMLLMLAAAWSLWRGTLTFRRPLLWLLMLAIPFPYIANTAGWMVAELGRQPWVIYGLMRTAAATSPRVPAGDVAFTLLGFCGLYALLSIVFLFLTGREIARGPE